MPTIPQEHLQAGETNPDNKPKRSKSLAARLRPSRKHSHRGSDESGTPTPLRARDTNENSEASSPELDRKAYEQHPVSPPVDEVERLALGSSTSSSLGMERTGSHGGSRTPVSPVERFKDGEAYFGSNGAGQEGGEVQRRPSVMKRLFSKRRNDKVRVRHRRAPH